MGERNFALVPRAASRLPPRRAVPASLVTTAIGEIDEANELLPVSPITKPAAPPPCQGDALRREEDEPGKAGRRCFRFRRDAGQGRGRAGIRVELDNAWLALSVTKTTLSEFTTTPYGSNSPLGDYVVHGHCAPARRVRRPRQRQRSRNDFVSWSRLDLLQSSLGSQGGRAGR